MGLTATAAVGLAAMLDALFAEFPGRVHPVALFGRAVTPFDREWAYPGLVGVLTAAVLPAIAAAVAGVSTAIGTGVAPALGAAVAGCWLFAASSLRMLLSAAAKVVDLAGSDPEAARQVAPALVGRDPATLSPDELRSAAVESAAENLADGLVAPLLAFVLGVQLASAITAGATLSLAAGSAAAAWVKAVNTLDSMLGYRSKPVGRASARLDDATMWLPARLTAVLLALAGRNPRALVRARRWHDEPPSPNSGWPMATLAAVLDVRLEKPGAYALNSGVELPDTPRAREGVRVVGVAGALSVLVAGGVVWI